MIETTAASREDWNETGELFAGEELVDSNGSEELVDDVYSDPSGDEAGFKIVTVAVRFDFALCIRFARWMTDVVWFWNIRMSGSG